MEGRESRHVQRGDRLPHRAAWRKLCGMTDSNDQFSWLWHEAPAAAQTPIRDVTHARVKGLHRKPRCLAHARSTGLPCQAAAMTNGRCRNHGGLASGPRTPAGRAKASDALRARWADPAFKAAQDERRRAKWADPVFRYKIALGLAKYHRRRDVQVLKARPRDLATLHWIDDRERVRRARLKALRLLVEAAKTDPR